MQSALTWRTWGQACAFQLLLQGAGLALAPLEFDLSSELDITLSMG